MKFRFVDRITSIRRGEKIQTQKAISFEELSLLKRWGRKGALPETLMLQFAAESACHLVAFTTNFQKICILEEVLISRFLRQTSPGDILRADLDMIEVDSHLYRFDFQMQTEKRKLADGSFFAAAVPLQRHFIPEDYILGWREMCDKTSGT